MPCLTGRRSPSTLSRGAALLFAACIASSALPAWAQPAPGAGSSEPPETGPELALPDRVEVDALEDDGDIATRLTRILETTEWFAQVEVSVDAGVVFLRGQADAEIHREWAGRLASHTSGVAAVVNKLHVPERSMWDLTPAWAELRRLASDMTRSLPLMGVGLLLLVLTWWLARGSTRLTGALLERRLQSALLRDVVARATAVPVFLLGLYGVLRISGLAHLAMTVLGGTGLLGLVVGFAFRDIAENFLASILLSMQRPFARGDLIQVGEHQGFVQHVNTRSTLLMTLEGNHLQIPNAIVYKQTIQNFTANPNVRVDFTVGIGYADSIHDAQTMSMDVLREHPAVLDDPESLVLVDSLGAATVNLRVYFWVDSSRHSTLKVRSAIIRLTKHRFDQEGISMPDEAREVVFPEGVPVRHLGEKDGSDASTASVASLNGAGDSEASEVHSAEGDLASEAPSIEDQARKARQPEGGADLLEER